MPLPNSVSRAAASVQQDDDDARRETRRRRYRLRESLWKVSTLKSVKGCARSVRSDAGVASLVRSAEGVAGWGGLTFCSSVSACPCCSPRIRQARAAMIEAAGVAHLRAGGGLVFGTFTMPHKAGMRLADLIAVERRAWKAVREDLAFRLLREDLGVRYVKAWEFTYTAAAIGGNGWHPHLHVLWFTDRPLDQSQLDRLFAYSTAPWAASIERQGYGRPDQFDLQAVDGRTNAAGLVRYLTKVQDNLDRGTWGPGQEMARGDLKRGRKRSRTPFELLASGVGQARDDNDNKLPACGEDLALWQEYEQATKGLRVIEATKGLYEQLGVQDVLDEDIPEVPAPAELAAVVAFDDYRLIARRRLGAWFLDLIEQGAGQDQVDDRIAALRRGETFRGRRHRPPARGPS